MTCTHLSSLPRCGSALQRTVVDACPGHAMPLGSYEALRSVWRQQVAIQNCHLQRHVLSHDVVISRPQLQGRSRHA